MCKLLRLFLLAATLALPRLGWGQLSNHYIPGTYILISDTSRHLAGQLRLKTQQKLLVITPAGRRLQLKPDQVSSFRIGPHAYTVVREFVVVQGSRARDVRAAFAEQLSNGSVTLWRYTHRWNTGGDWLFLYRYPLTCYLVAGTGPHLAPIYDQGSPEAFRRQVRPLLQQYPGLLRLLEKGRLTYASLPEAIRALNLNMNAPFSPAISD